MTTWRGLICLGTNRAENGEIPLENHILLRLDARAFQVVIFYGETKKIK
jgi:hypothetical protein